MATAARKAPRPEPDHPAAPLLREWHRIAEELAPLKPDASKIDRLARHELQARKAVGFAMGAAGGTVVVDGLAYTYTRGQKGGGQPDYKRLYEQAVILAGPALRATLEKLPTLPAYQEEPTPTHGIAVAPVGLVGVDGGKGR